MSNFQFLLSDPGFASFAEVAVAAEKILHIDPAACIINCRRSMEFAIKWMYSVDDDLEMPDQDNLLRLMSQKDFRAIVGTELWQRMDFIRRKGNTAAHAIGKISEGSAMICLENLHAFLDFLAYCYGEDHAETVFDPKLVPTATSQSSKQDPIPPAPDLAKLMEENRKLKAHLTARREEHQKSYVPKPLELSEYETRKFYIDAMLEDIGWTEGMDWRNEIELSPPDPTGQILTADYVLYDDGGIPLAIIEALKTGSELSLGLTKAQLCAEAIEKQYGRKPVIFLTNGFETHILHDTFPRRKCSDLYSKSDLEKLFRIQRESTPLKEITIAASIADRYYQEDAVRAVCRSLEEEQARKALLVMAAGSGKTRTVIALCDVLLRHKKAERILFLSHRSSPLTQAKRSFEEFLPTVTTDTLKTIAPDPKTGCIFSTYDRMMEAIDSMKDTEGKHFTCGYFDLVIWDEVHPSIYNQYREIFRYFDAPLLGLTATPRSEVPEGIYRIFHRNNAEPTYAYEPAQAVRDGYLVDFLTVKTDLQAPTTNTSYEDLTEKEREQWEKDFANTPPELPEKVLSSALNRWIFNDDIIRQGLRIVMEEAIKDPTDALPGKTILFAKNHNHARKILSIFQRDYPTLLDFAQIIDSQVNGVQRLIDQFSDPESLPRIAISVDLLDTGIDIPACVNLVFFKRVLSREKFRQMIGRGSRPCPTLHGGKDRFYIFDFCGNFEFFRLKDVDTAAGELPLPAVLFSLKLRILQSLQESDLSGGTSDYLTSLIHDLSASVQALDRDHFAVRQHLKCVELYSDPEQYRHLSHSDLSQLQEELTPLLLSETASKNTLSFDALLYAAQLALLTEQYKEQIISRLSKVLYELTIQKAEDLPHQEISLLKKYQPKECLKNAHLQDLETLRTTLRHRADLLPEEKLSLPQEFLSAIFPFTRSPKSQ